MIQLQGVNKLFYTRVAQWIRVVILFPKIRLSKPVGINQRSNKKLVFPSAAMMRAWRGVSALAGFENSEEYGGGVRFNFILSNGTRSTQRDADWPTKYTRMIPADVINKIRSVTVYHHDNRTYGFSFFDKDGRLLWKIGFTHSS